MRRLAAVAATVGCLASAAASAQAGSSISSASGARPLMQAPRSMGNTASLRTHLEALHYQGVHDLRRGPDGQWTATARQGGVPKTVTIAPDGTVTAR